MGFFIKYPDVGKENDKFRNVREVLRLVGIAVERFRRVGELISEVGEFLEDPLDAVVESGDFPMEGNNLLLQRDVLIFRGPFRGRKRGHGSVWVH